MALLSAESVLHSFSEDDDINEVEHEDLNSKSQNKEVITHIGEATTTSVFDQGMKLKRKERSYGHGPAWSELTHALASFSSQLEHDATEIRSLVDQDTARIKRQDYDTHHDVATEFLEESLLRRLDTTEQGCLRVADRLLGQSETDTQQDLKTIETSGQEDVSFDAFVTPQLLRHGQKLNQKDDSTSVGQPGGASLSEVTEICRGWHKQNDQRLIHLLNHLHSQWGPLHMGALDSSIDKTAPEKTTNEISSGENCKQTTTSFDAEDCNSEKQESSWSFPYSHHPSNLEQEEDLLTDGILSPFRGRSDQQEVIQECTNDQTNSEQAPHLSTPNSLSNEDEQEELQAASPSSSQDTKGVLDESINSPLFSSFEKMTLPLERVSEGFEEEYDEQEEDESENEHENEKGEENDFVPKELSFSSPMHLLRQEAKSLETYFEKEQQQEEEEEIQDITNTLGSMHLQPKTKYLLQIDNQGGNQTENENQESPPRNNPASSSSSKSQMMKACTEATSLDEEGNKKNSPPPLRMTVRSPFENIDCDASASSMQSSQIDIINGIEHASQESKEPIRENHQDVGNTLQNGDNEELGVSTSGPLRQEEEQERLAANDPPRKEIYDKEDEDSSQEEDSSDEEESTDAEEYEDESEMEESIASTVVAPGRVARIKKPKASRQSTIPNKNKITATNNKDKKYGDNEAGTKENEISFLNTTQISSIVPNSPDMSSTSAISVSFSSVNTHNRSSLLATPDQHREVLRRSLVLGVKSPLSRTPMAAAWISKQMQRQDDKDDCEQPSHHHAMLKDACSPSSPNNQRNRLHDWQHEKDSVPVTAQPCLGSKYGESDAMVVKNETASFQRPSLVQNVSREEYKASPRIVTMQVSLEEVDTAVDILNSWWEGQKPASDAAGGYRQVDTAEEKTYKYTESSSNKLCIGEEVALDLLKEKFGARKGKTVLMSLCHWRRMIMEVVPTEGDDSIGEGEPRRRVRKQFVVCS